MALQSSLEVNLKAFSENIRLLRDIALGKNILFMVKADAYGHGILRLSKFAYHEEGISNFGVASLDEACKLRENLKDDKVNIIVFSNTFLQSSYSTYIDKKLIPVISGLEGLSFFLQHSVRSRLPLFLKFNTGMNRLGIRWDKIEDVVKILKKFRKHNIEHMMSHFANASLPMNDKLNIAQRQRFEDLKKYVRDRGIGIEQTSLANSGAIEQRVGLNESHIRPGLMLYGPSALCNERGESPTPWKGSLISTFKALVLRTFKVRQNTPIGYDGTLTNTNGHVAVVSVGYADGLLRVYEGCTIPYKSNSLKVFGRVSMDMMHLFSQEDSPFPKSQEILPLWCQDNFKALSKHSKLSPYEMLCIVGSRIPRVYRLK